MINNLKSLMKKKNKKKVETEENQRNFRFLIDAWWKDGLASRWYDYCTCNIHPIHKKKWKTVKSNI